MYYPVPPDRFLSALLGAPCCSLCGSGLETNTICGSRFGICRSCLSGLCPIEPPVCRICGRQLISEIGICTHCRKRPYPFRDHISLYDYYGTAKKLLHQYKFGGIKRLAGLFAELIAGKFAALGELRPLIPIPGNPSSVQKRGWDQIGEIGRILSADYNLDVRNLLGRRRSSTQKSLDYVQRQSNLHGKIYLKHSSRRSLSLPGAVLLDDVFTTGSTAAECTRILQNAGISSISVITIAID